MNEIMFLQENLPKLLLAALIGGLVGLERGTRGGNTPTGFSTLAILTLSTCMATVLAMEVASQEFMRVFAGLLSSVGFIGAGPIFTQRSDDNEKSVKGLTSASIIFFLAIIGITIGLGYYVTAITAVIVAEISISVSKLIKKKRKEKGVDESDL